MLKLFNKNNKNNRNNRNYYKNHNKNIKIINYTRNYNKTQKVMLFTNARNEKKLREWASHHLLIGFDLIIIFDHKSNPRLINDFLNFDKRVQIIRCGLENPVKLILMMHAVKIAKFYKADWLLYLDSDEFLILNHYNGVKQMLNQYNHAHSLAINWLMFGTNNLLKEPNGLILENYTKSELKLDHHVKSFVRPYEVINAVNPHFYNIRNKNKMYNIQNKIMNPNYPYYFNEFPIPYYNSPAYIAHYIYQSEETYVERKLNLPRDDDGTYRTDYRKHNEFKKIHNVRVFFVFCFRGFLEER